MKKSNKIILVIVAILVIALIGGGIFIIINNDKKPNEQINEVGKQTTNLNSQSQINENNQANTDNVENKVDNNAANTSSNESQNVTEDEMYESVINDYKKAIGEYDENDIEILEKIEEKYSMVNSAIIFHVMHYKDEGAKMLYSFYDVDKNGVKELIIGIGNNNSKDFYEGAVYSYNQNNDKPERIYYQSTMERGKLHIYDNGIILSEGSGGAELHYYNFGKISKDGSSFKSIENIIEEYTQGNKNPVYRDYDSNKVLNYKNLDEIKDKYISNSKAVEFNNYSEI